MVSPSNIDISKLGSDMLRFTSSVDQLDNPDDVLDHLHKVTIHDAQLSVLGAAQFPLRWGDMAGVELGKTVFLHKSTPEGWWEEHVELSRSQPGCGFMFSQLSLAPFTMSELMRILEPLGAERWPFELGLKYGMRDRFNCPVGGRWVVTYWSKTVLTSRLSEKARAILFMGGTFAAIRLQKLVQSSADRIGQAISLTPRELAVLRLLSVGHQLKDTASLLELGEETVRTHLKKAQAKLGVKSRTHAVAQAIRRRLIP
ncbi:response regulator transcription factor [Hyphomicrobium sp.]|uniref:response regulator transcription factor n=1 Tax=Hyphomicrobium sp. TaxID=82 RepID=UPI002E37896E|nr:LuxR C-terminal-related transcriptional regulator [Hyphomicrobium sp.]HEX2843496.1 LuxR C-terminal-related transcriptional regulator [Hyphomicrobium sp.]